MKKRLILAFLLFAGLCWATELKIGIVTDTHYTTQEREEAVGPHLWPIWMNGSTPRHMAACLDKVAKVNETFDDNNVDVIVHLGDLYNYPSMGDNEYSLVHPIIDVEGVDVLYCPGNHDVSRGTITKDTWPTVVGQASHYMFTDIGNLRIFTLNTVVKKVQGEETYVYVGDEELGQTFEDDTYFPPDQMAWLDAKLTEADGLGKYSIVCGHYVWFLEPQPASTSIMKNGPDLMDMLQNHRVIACFAGHRHVPSVGEGFINSLGKEILCIGFEACIDNLFGEVEGVVYSKAACNIATVDDSSGKISVRGYNGGYSYNYDVFPIENWFDLSSVGVNGGIPADASIILVNDLTPSTLGYVDVSAGTDWVPLSRTPETALSGDFNGNHKKIDGVKIRTTSYAGFGLFQYLSGCTIYDLKITNIDYDVNSSICGGLAASIQKGKFTTIRNVYVQGSIKVEYSAGGLLGYDSAESLGLIEGCVVDVDITTSRDVASNNHHYTGGFIGRVRNEGGLEIKNCVSMGDVLADCPTYGAPTRLGGFCGTMEKANTIENCLAVGSVSANVGEGGAATSIGGFCGNKAIAATILNCYYDTTTSGQTGDTKGIGLPTSTLQNANIVATLTTAGWDFTANGVWAKRAGEYPELWWQVWELYDQFDAEDDYTITLKGIDIKRYFLNRNMFIKDLKDKFVAGWSEGLESIFQDKWKGVWEGDGLDLESEYPSLTIKLGGLDVGGSKKDLLLGGKSLLGG
jgi:hypothetical protein